MNDRGYGVLGVREDMWGFEDAMNGLQEFEHLGIELCSMQVMQLEPKDYGDVDPASIVPCNYWLATLRRIMPRIK